MASKVPPNIPYSIAVPSGSPNSILGIAGFLTTLMVGLNSWINRAATAINANLAAAAGSITEIVAGAGLTGGGSTGSVAVALESPVATALGGTGSASGISLTGDVAGGPAAPSIATTLATVNSDVGTFQGLTVNAKGLAIAAETTSAQQTTVTSAPGTISANKMLGLAGGITTGAATSGRVFVAISGDAGNSTLSDTTIFTIALGTGTAPANGAAITGTTYGGTINFQQAVAADRTPFCIVALATGLAGSTTYWVDLQVNLNGGAVAVGAANVVAFEV